ncbi:MAG: glycine dehydrogenase (aminomethyl-transferring) [Marinilabiliales bacterium]|nr:MAG: glycine dehydrogenase (aminomethyl-transferring) [Marinilabiliales bacterium]
MITDKFVDRHIGPREQELTSMLKKIGVDSLDHLIDETVPKKIRLQNKLNLPEGMSEYEYTIHLKEIASKNKQFRSYIGQGYYNTITPAVIQRNILENPSWYTSYTPYQAEISQGRLEALLNYQTMVMDLTGMDMANASLLDEATAAAEAMIMLYNARPRSMVKDNANVFLVDENIFEQTLKVVETRALPLNIEIKKSNYSAFDINDKVFGVLVQYPAGDGDIRNYEEMAAKAHATNCKVAVAADLLSLALLKTPAEWGADVVVGSTQRFGLPMGFGGPHAGYFATNESFKRHIPGRIIGVSKDANGKLALRMALQTREQHIKRERATSNICTAQALLANMSGMYAVYHGPEGIKKIAEEAHSIAGYISEKIEKLGYEQLNKSFFDTLKIKLPDSVYSDQIKKIALNKEINLNYIDNKTVGLSTDESITEKDIEDIINIFAEAVGQKYTQENIQHKTYLNPSFLRESNYLQLPVFNSYHCETEMMRYIKKLERRDFSLTHSMISLGSCTMKLNAAVQMIPVTWPEWNIHPFVPTEQSQGYKKLIKELGNDLCEITGFSGISFQPNSGAAGEYSGLLTIRGYHASRGQGHRNIVLIPASAHGTNPASAVMAGMKVVVVACDENGNVNIDDLKAKAEEHKDNLSAFMITYPSTHGVFEEAIMDMNKTIHDNGGQVYMDGANMNAQVGLTNPGLLGADVCHLNLHKTFAIPHGGGGPGVGPICVAEHLVPFLPKHPVIETGGENGPEAISAAPYGSASVLCISHAYIKLLGEEGLTYSTKIAILNANYLASSLKDKYKILYTGEFGRVAHEMILECRNFKPESGITETDIAKRLMDYGFHAPTLSFPVHGTLMVEPTESESLQELDRFIEAMESIHNEIEEVKNGQADKENNVLKNAPHTAELVISDNWDKPYKREKAAYPLAWIAENKFFPSVGRIDDAFGDRNLMCSCKPIYEYES